MGRKKVWDAQQKIAEKWHNIQQKGEGLRMVCCPGREGITKTQRMERILLKGGESKKKKGQDASLGQGGGSEDRAKKR